MDNYYLRVKGGDVIELQLKPKNIQSALEQLHSVLEVVNILSSVVKPLVINLDLACRLINESYIDDNVMPLKANHQICESGAQNKYSFSKSVHGNNTLITVVPEITNELLVKWAECALEQDIASERHQITLDTLKSKFTRTRLFHLNEPVDSVEHVTLQKNNKVLQIPVEKRDDKVWVTGLVEGLLQYSPIELEFLNHDGWLNANIWLSWGPFWLSPNTQEQQTLEQSLVEIIAQGWEPISVPSVFNLG